MTVTGVSLVTTVLLTANLSMMRRTTRKNQSTSRKQRRGGRDVAMNYEEQVNLQGVSFETVCRAGPLQPVRWNSG